MTAAYNKSSPYYTTVITNGYMDVLTLRDIPSTVSDVPFTISPKYENRPDLLANDLYNDSKLWWVFAVRNKTVIKDPIFDMVPGTVIFLPQLSTLKSSLGI
jgi:hypothetical protein